jgi:hypothetical protein
MPIVIALLLLSPGACAPRDRAPGWRGPAVAEARVATYFGRETWDIIEYPDRIEVHRLDAAAALNPGGDSRPRLARYPVVGEPVSPSPGWTERLRRVIRDSDSYAWNRPKLCKPRPGVGVRFTRGGDRVDLWLCYECSILGMDRYTGAQTQPAASPSRDFDPAAERLIALAKEVFPHDHQIQELVPE